jgi:hypothetical protein
LRIGKRKYQDSYGLFAASKQRINSSVWCLRNNGRSYWTVIQKIGAVLKEGRKRSQYSCTLMLAIYKISTEGIGTNYRVSAQNIFFQEWQKSALAGINQESVFLNFNDYKKKHNVSCKEERAHTNTLHINWGVVSLIHLDPVDQIQLHR